MHSQVPHGHDFSGSFRLEVSKHTCMFCDGSGKQKVEPKEGEVEEEKAVKAHCPTWVWKS